MNFHRFSSFRYKKIQKKSYLSQRFLIFFLKLLQWFLTNFPKIFHIIFFLQFFTLPCLFLLFKIFISQVKIKYHEKFRAFPISLIKYNYNSSEFHKGKFANWKKNEKKNLPGKSYYKFPRINPIFFPFHRKIESK